MLEGYFCAQRSFIGFHSVVTCALRPGLRACPPWLTEGSVPALQGGGDSLQQFPHLRETELMQVILGN